MFQLKFEMSEPNTLTQQTSYTAIIIPLYETQNKKEYAYNQSCARRSAVFLDIGQTEKERAESHEWTLMFMLLV